MAFPILQYSITPFDSLTPLFHFIGLLLFAADVTLDSRTPT